MNFVSKQFEDLFNDQWRHKRPREKTGQEPKSVNVSLRLEREETLLDLKNKHLRRESFAVRQTLRPLSLTWSLSQITHLGLLPGRENSLSLVVYSRHTLVVVVVAVGSRQKRTRKKARKRRMNLTSFDL